VALTTTRAVILQTYRYSDTSKILRFMTLEHGPCSAIAKGALRPRSRFGGMLDPFVEGDATLYTKEGRDLHTLSGFELVRERRDLGRSLRAYTIASVLCELVMRLAPEHRDDRLYGSLVAGLDALLDASSRNGGVGGLEHVWGLVSTLGFHPELERCLHCGRQIGKERARFDYAAGGVVCAECATPGLEAEELHALRRLARGEAAPDPDGRQGRWLADFIRYHLAEGANLRSLPFLRSLP
jgi:DNA repair protein RecO (recombination protein O)